MGDSRWPKLKGRFLPNKYVAIRGAEQRDHLRTLGHFGRDLDEIKKKDDTKRGPEDCWILESAQAIDTGEPTMILSVHEAFFLMYALGCLAIESGGKLMNIDDCWLELKKFNQEANSTADFAEEFGVYFYFRTRGWIIKSGHNFGVDFLLYKDSPSLVHSNYAIVIQSGRSNNLSSWQEVLAHTRVIQSAGKELLVVFVDHPTGVHQSPACIRELQVRVTKMTCKINVMI